MELDGKSVPTSNLRKGGSPDAFSTRANDNRYLGLNIFDLRKILTFHGMYLSKMYTLKKYLEVALNKKDTVYYLDPDTFPWPFELHLDLSYEPFHIFLPNPHMFGRISEADGSQDSKE